MEVRSRHYKVLGKRIALGNSGNGLVEGYATIKEIVEIPYSEISKHENQHLATRWLKPFYRGKDWLYGYVLKDVVKESNPFPYPKSASIWFVVK